MKVLNERPPNFDQIVAAFPLAGSHGVIFAYGSIIYNPTGIVVTAGLRAHENVHREQQGDDPEGWWSRYIEDTDFRLAQEIPAHEIELVTMLAGVTDRDRRRWSVAVVAKKLSLPLYRYPMPLHKAETLMRLTERSLRP